MTNPIHSSKSLKGSEPSRRGHGRVTLADVAAFAGVTTMTVSRYLRSPERVAEHTAKHIAQALQDTGYTPNLQAGSLASGRSQAVAVIVPNIAHSIFADTLHGLGTSLQAAGLHMLVLSTGYSLDLEEAHVRTVLGWAPAAIVVTGRRHKPGTQQLLLAAQARGTPVVEIWDQSPERELRYFQQIGFNHVDAGAMMANALITRGFTSLCFMDSCVAEDFRAHERCEGFMTAAHHAGITAVRLMPQAGDALEMGQRCFAAWHKQQHDHLFCGLGFANDLLATGALMQAHRLGSRVPQELGFLGFGDFPVGRYCAGGLSTMHIQGERIGQACASMIQDALRQTRGVDLRATASGYREDSRLCTVISPELLWRHT